MRFKSRCMRYDVSRVRPKAFLRDEIQILLHAVRRMPGKLNNAEK